MIILLTLLLTTALVQLPGKLCYETPDSCQPGNFTAIRRKFIRESLSPLGTMGIIETLQTSRMYWIDEGFKGVLNWTLERRKLPGRQMEK